MFILIWLIGICFSYEIIALSRISLNTIVHFKCMYLSWRLAEG